MRLWEDYKQTMVETDDIWNAAKYGDLLSIHSFIEQGEDINAKDHRGYSPLMLAAYAGDIATVRYLLSQRADPNTEDGAGNTVLMGVCFKGHIEIAKLLCLAGADIHKKNQSGMDAYDFAVTFGRKDIMTFLKEKET